MEVIYLTGSLLMEMLISSEKHLQRNILKKKRSLTKYLPTAKLTQNHPSRGHTLLLKKYNAIVGLVYRELETVHELH